MKKEQLKKEFESWCDTVYRSKDDISQEAIAEWWIGRVGYKECIEIHKAFIVMFSDGSKDIRWYMPSVKEKKHLEKEYNAKIYPCDILIYENK